jgi:hypothetical protein
MTHVFGTKRCTWLVYLVATTVLGCRSETKKPIPTPSSRAGDSTGSPTAIPMSSARTLEQLLDSDQRGIALVRNWVGEAKNHVEVLPIERSAGERALLGLQVTSRSAMGAVALETGGILIDHGWIRVLGGGHARLPRAINDWNDISPAHLARRLPGAVLVADDAVGGFFALNGDGIPGAPMHLFYFSPTTLEWEDIAPSYSDWLTGMLNGELTKFYEGMRWPGWEKEMTTLPGDRAFSIYPFLCAEGPEVGKRSRRPVPIQELWSLHVETLPKQLAPR